MKNKEKYASKEKEKAKEIYIYKIAWLLACFLGDVKVIWCNSLGDSYFQTYVMNNVESVFILYIYMSPCEYFMHLLVAHTTSKSLLNFVHVIMCQVLWPSKI